MGPVLAAKLRIILRQIGEDYWQQAKGPHGYEPV
jgi:hypothetical protein